MTGEEYQAAATVFADVQGEPVIVELGAYCGEDGLNFDRMAGPNLFHIMVEPDPRNYAVIEANEVRKLDAKRHLVKGAIASVPGKRAFNFSYDTRDGSRGSGSLLEPTGHRDHFPTIGFVYKDMVDCYTLDQIFDFSELTKIDLLWVDIQGAEKEMIMGGQKSLRHTRYLFMEAEEIEMYAGQLKKADLVKALPPGWRLLRDFGFNIFLANDKFEVAQ